MPMNIALVIFSFLVQAHKHGNFTGTMVKAQIARTGKVGQTLSTKYIVSEVWFLPGCHSPVA